jgi:asparagine synthase (glutamine-hydrolysing)
MCGFVVIVGRAGRLADRAVVERMVATIAHRGPDDSGFWSNGSVAMGFRRLAIIDRSLAAHQPMLAPDGQAVLVFNGEIFNYVELRDELRSLGHQFHSTGDTEVLLAAWRQWGENCVDHLVGMFAFVIWDERRRVLFGARDRFGVKPLFAYRGKDVVMLASEIKAIQASGLYEHEENWEAIAGYLLTGTLDDGVATCFRGIEHIPPAHSFNLAFDGSLRQRRYFDLPEQTLERTDDAPEMLARLLEDSVRIRMRSDLPTGVCLSGGLDSTAIVCEMARRRELAHDPQPLLAFNYNTRDYDESAYIAETLRVTGATLVSSRVTEREMWDSMPRVMHFHDEPLHSMNALVSFDLMRLARQHGAIVVLNGQGADEILAGYSSFYGDYWTSLVASGRMREAAREIGAYARAFGVDRWKLEAQVARQIGFRAVGLAPGYGLLAGVARRILLRRNPWFSRELVRNAPDRVSSPGIRLEHAQRQSLTTDPLPLLLRVEDRNSMAHGVEVRVPFLDHRLVSYALALPIDWRIRGPWNKYVLREALRGRIPESVRTRQDKMGFPVPTGRWFARELYEPLRDLIGSQAARQRGLYRTDALLRELDRSRGAHVDNHRVLFRVANMEMWFSMIASRGSGAQLGSGAGMAPVVRAAQDVQPLARASRNALPG